MTSPRRPRDPNDRGADIARSAVAPRGALAALGAVALLLVAGGWFLPLWTATLHAPQYPGGLTMRAYGHDVTGDVDEISALNHYVGMRPFDIADFPEMALWPYALAVAAVAVVVALLIRRRVVRGLALVYLWGTPLGVLAVIQFRLHQYGTNLEPGAALRLDPFTPLVVGPTTVWNFVTWSWPGLGLACVGLAAALVTFGPGLAARLKHRGGGAAAAALAVALLLAPVANAPSAAADTGGSPGALEGATPLAEVLEGATAGQRIVLPPGIYLGGAVIDVPIVLEGRQRPTVVGDGTGTVLTVRAPGTVVRGIAVRGSGPGPTDNPAGIRVVADGVTIEDVVVADTYIGIAVESAASARLVGNTIRGRAGAAIVDEGHALEHDRDEAVGEHTHGAHGHEVVVERVQSRGDGIWLHDVDHVLIRGNVIEHARDGVYVSFGSGALIDGNVVRDSRYAVHSMFAEDLTLVENHFHDNMSGAVLMYRGPALLLRNHIERSTSASTGFAVLLKDVIEVQAIENLLVDNRVGLHIDGPAGAQTPALMASNTVARNAIGVSAYPSARAAFRTNSFVDNLVQVVAQGGRLTGMTWSERGWGNYWSSYRGYEGRARGRGAVPHVEGGTVDRLLARNPELIAIARSPGLRLLRTVEERWGRRNPVLTDELPITTPLSPPVPSAAAEPAGRAAAALTGAVLLLPAAALLWRSRQRSATSRRRRALVGVSA